MPILMFRGKHMPQFQAKYLDEDDWKEVSEKEVLEKLVDEFDRVNPVYN